MKRLNGRQANYVMFGVCGFLFVFLVGSTILVNKWLHTRSDKLVGVKLENKILDDQQTALLAANKTVQQYSELNKIAKAIVPQDKDQAKAVREIVKLAADNDIRLGAISFPASTLGQTNTKTNNGVTQVKPVDGISGVFVMEINVQQDASAPTTYAKLIEFLTQLENNRRTAQVTNVTVQPTPQDRNKLTFSLVLNTYIKP